MTETALPGAASPKSHGPGTPPAPDVVRFENVGKAFGQVKAVDGLSLALRPGETVALLGPNGAGKSTTLDLLLGLRNADGGSVRVFGGTPRQAIESGRVGAMLQSGGLMEDVTVREIVRLACSLHPRARAVDEVLAGADLTSIGDRMVNKLSGGQEQRVRFAIATAGASDLLVLDEPTTGMDVSARQAFWETMREQVRHGRTVLFATHYLEEADAIADRVDEALLRGLPEVAGLEVSGRTVRIRSTDADVTVHAVYAAGLYPRNLEVAGLGLEQAFLAITEEATTEEAATERAARKEAAL
jgi:ABC-2 type transport system ATP-binding protein